MMYVTKENQFTLKQQQLLLLLLQLLRVNGAQ